MSGCLTIILSEEKQIHFSKLCVHFLYLIYSLLGKLEDAQYPKTKWTCKREKSNHLRYIDVLLPAATLIGSKFTTFKTIANYK